jgi:hypothetical protein
MKPKTSLFSRDASSDESTTGCHLTSMVIRSQEANPVAILDKNADTSTMTLRNATVFAIVGMALGTIHLALDLITGISGVAGGFIPANSLLKSLIDFLAVFSLLVFFVVFHRKQS